jgi:branched-chain amino acid transport system permease protein
MMSIVIPPFEKGSESKGTERVNAELLLQGIASGLLIGGVYALVAVGLTLVYGVLNIINFAHGALLVVGMYASYFLFFYLGIDPYLSVLVVIPVLFTIGALSQKIVINPLMNAPAHICVFVTIGLGYFLENFLSFAWSPEYKNVDVSYARTIISVGEVTIPVTRLVTFGLAIFLTIALYLFLKKTDTGKAIRACAQEKEAAVLMGIDTKRIFVITYGIGAACAGAAGAFILPFFYLGPYVGHTFLLTALIVVVFGSMGNFWGAFMAGLIIGLGESIGEIVLPSAMKEVVSLSIFIIVLFFRPVGLMGSSR